MKSLSNVIKESFFKNMGVGIEAEKPRILKDILELVTSDKSLSGYEVTVFERCFDKVVKVEDDLSVSIHNIYESIGVDILKCIENGGYKINSIYKLTLYKDELKYLRFAEKCKYILILNDIPVSKLKTLKIHPNLRCLVLRDSEVQSFKHIPKSEELVLNGCNRLQDTKGISCKILKLCQCHGLNKSIVVPGVKVYREDKKGGWIHSPNG